MKVFAYQHGIYPRSEKVVAATRGLDRGRTDEATVDHAFDDDLTRWIQIQREAGMDFFSDGLLRWQDIFRPLLKALAIKPHTLVRWFDTNTFFREPEFSGTVPTLNSSKEFVPNPSVPRPRVTTLPSPYMFSRAAHTDQDRNRLMLDLARQVLRPVIDAAVSTGSELIHLEEPWLAYHGIDTGDWAPLGDALSHLQRDLRATVVFHVYFGDAAPYLAELRRLPVNAIGIDLLDTDARAIGSDWDKGLVAGVVNGRHSVVESADKLVEAARYLADTVRQRNLYLSSNCELAFLPTGVAEQKVQRLGQAARKFKELVSV